MKTHINTRKVYYALIAFGGLLLVAYIFILAFNFNRGDATTSGAIGDAFGGIATPFIGTAGVLLTFLAFWVQFEANERQRVDIRQERFENRFFELLQAFTNSVEALSLYHGRYKGKTVFINIFTEIRCAYLIMEGFLNSKPHFMKMDENKREELLIEAAYELVFLGYAAFDRNRHPELLKFEDEDDEYDFVYLMNQYYITGYDEWVEIYGNGVDTLLENPYRIILEKGKFKFGHRFPYRPFPGHLSRLGHYFRQLYQLLKLIDQREDLDLEEKYEFIKVLRAQLSTHEQAVLFFNSFWGAGKKLWSDYDTRNSRHSYFILDYKLIKNLPFHMFDFTISPETKFRKELENAYPEWDSDERENYLRSSFETLES